MGSAAGSPDPTRLDARPALVRPVVAIAATLGLVLAALTGFWVARLDGPPSSASAEAGFARDMQTHHAQAVEMAFLIRDRSEDADLTRLADADGVAAEKLFLELMIAHHNGGVEMAKAVLERTQRSEVRNLAQSMVNAQSAEIQTMTQMLAARG